MLRARTSPTAEAGFSAVLAAARSGDGGAITSLYRTFNPALVRFLEGRAAGAGADLAQDTWIALCAGLAGFDGDEHQFRAWLFTVARRRSIDHWRRAGRRPSTTNDPECLARLGSLDSAMGDLSAREAVAELVRHLSPEQADVVLLRVVADLSVEEVATIMGKSPGAVRVMQHRALRRLAAILGPAGVTA